MKQRSAHVLTLRLEVLEFQGSSCRTQSCRSCDSGAVAVVCGVHAVSVGTSVHRLFRCGFEGTFLLPSPSPALHTAHLLDRASSTHTGRMAATAKENVSTQHTRTNVT